MRENAMASIYGENGLIQNGTATDDINNSDIDEKLN
jgi:hypothetical protein